MQRSLAIMHSFRTRVSAATHVAHLGGTATVAIFALMSVATSKPKPSGAVDAGAGATTAAAAAGAIPTGTLIGSCDRSDTFHKDCDESYLPAKAADEARKCKDLDGKFYASACPRIGALTQCFEGYAPNLFASYTYEGRKTLPDADDCARGFRDLKKNPELKESASPATCDAVAHAGQCIEFTTITAANERACLTQEGTFKPGGDPCPRTNVLLAGKYKEQDGSDTNQYFYTTPINDGITKHDPWEKGLVKLWCAGAHCTQFDASAAPIASAHASQPANVLSPHPTAAVKIVTPPASSVKIVTPPASSVKIVTPPASAVQKPPAYAPVAPKK